MGKSDFPEVSQARLLNCSTEECSYYWKWFRKLGGKRKPIQLSKLKQFLQRSELSQENLADIVKIAIQGYAEVDFESFCVACRLVAHGQQLGVIDAAHVGEVPTNAPWFSDEAQPVQEKVEEKVPAGPAGDFDFEAVALGVEATPGTWEILAKEIICCLSWLRVCWKAWCV